MLMAIIWFALSIVAFILAVALGSVIFWYLLDSQNEYEIFSCPTPMDRASGVIPWVVIWLALSAASLFSAQAGLRSADWDFFLNFEFWKFSAVWMGAIACPSYALGSRLFRRHCWLHHSRVVIRY